MPVGTAGTVKAMTADAGRATGADIVLGNTYHLMLRPGPSGWRLGGLHKFMDWDGPILTDSGGFQVMSLSKLRKMDKDGVTFQSHIDGEKFRLTPGAVDRDPGRPAGLRHRHAAGRMRRLAGRATRKPRAPCELFHAGRSAPRTLSGRDRLGLFGIQQGSDLRKSARREREGLTDIGFEGYAIGGLAVGEGHRRCARCWISAPDMLPESHPRYLMGVGKPIDLIEAVRRGVDMFDCVMPTRSGRHGQAWTWDGSDQPQERPLRRGRHAAGRHQRLPGLAATIPRPICTTWSRPRKSWARCCCPGTTSPSSRP
jgi:queuine tRNA-ribosyltransferase